MSAATSASSQARTVIVGAGQAGCELASALAQQGQGGRIVLIGDEPWLPYRRPPLSKAFLAGEVGTDALLLKPQAAYDKAGIECLTGVTVTAIDRATRSLQFADGRRLAYGKLALTTGGRVRTLPLHGADRPNLHYLRNIADVQQLHEGFRPGRRLVIIGGGYVGLEVAAVACKRGLQVTVVEALPRVLARVTAPEMSAYYEMVHRSHGVDIRTGIGVAALEASDRVEAVVLADGTRLAADLVVVGIGLIPNTELAQAAGLAVDNGIVVDRQCRTSDPEIVAAGDCTHHDNGFLQRRTRLESVPNALEQARVAAATLCGKPADYGVAPWFWSDQYDLKLQMVGLSQGYDHLVLRGQPAEHSFTVFYLQEGRILSVDTVNRPQEFMVSKRLVAERICADPATLADEAIPLKSLLENRVTSIG